MIMLNNFYALFYYHNRVDFESEHIMRHTNTGSEKNFWCKILQGENEWDEMDEIKAGFADLHRRRQSVHLLPAAFNFLVFDLDLDSYNRDGCGCKNQRKCCLQCFECFGLSGAYIMQHILSEIFGIDEVFFVYSGRRGIHIWAKLEPITCKEQLHLHESERSEIMQQLSSGFKKLTPQLDNRVFHVLRDKIFDKYFFRGGSWFSKEWESLRGTYKINNQDEFYAIYGTNPNNTLKNFIFRLFWPKLDENVTKQPVHYVQMPFSFHRVNCMQSCTLLPTELLGGEEELDLITIEDMIQRANNDSNKELKYCNLMSQRMGHTFDVLKIAV